MRSTTAACAAATKVAQAEIAARAAAAAETEARAAATTVRAAASEAGAGSGSSRCGGHIGMGRRGMDSARGASGGSGCGCSGGGGCCTGGSCIPRTVRAAVAGAAPLQHPCAASGVSSPGHFGSNRAHGKCGLARRHWATLGVKCTLAVAGRISPPPSECHHRTPDSLRCRKASCCTLRVPPS